MNFRAFQLCYRTFYTVFFIVFFIQLKIEARANSFNIFHGDVKF